MVTSCLARPQMDGSLSWVDRGQDFPENSNDDAGIWAEKRMDFSGDNDDAAVLWEDRERFFPKNNNDESTIWVAGRRESPQLQVGPGIGYQSNRNPPRS